MSKENIIDDICREFDKVSFNKENVVDLFSQLVKVLIRMGVSDKLVNNLRVLSRDIFKEMGNG